MASPQLTAQTNGQSSNRQKSPGQTPRTYGELESKYNRLKRKYFEMESRMKEERREKDDAQTHMLRMKTERRAMLDRISQLEADSSAPQGYDHRSNAFAVLPKPPQPSAASLSYLKQTLDLDERDEDPDEARRHSRILRTVPPPTIRSWKDDELENHNTLHQLPQAGATTSSTRGGRRKSSKSTGKRSDQQELHPNASTLVSSGGTKLRIKPPHSLGDPHGIPAHGGDMGPPPAADVKFLDISPISPMHHSPTQTRPISPQTSYARTHSPPTRFESQTRVPSAQRSTKPKRLKAHTVTAKTTSVPIIPRDPKTNLPILPLNVGIMTVHNIGEVCRREHFHTERYIFPIGYEVTRRYLSSTDPNRDVTYHCKILEGPSGPIFQIKAPDIDVIEAGTATGAWSGIVKTSNAIRNRQHSNSVSGPDYFGLGQNTIKHLIQGLPGADSLRDYVWQHYVEGGPLGGRHAAVMPALPEDSGDYYATRMAADSMDLDHEDQESVSLDSADMNIREGSLIRSSSTTPAPQARHRSPMLPNTDKRPVSPDVRKPPGALQSPSARGVPSSMASILNNYPSTEHSHTRSPSSSTTLKNHNTAVSVARDSSGKPLMPLEFSSSILYNLGAISPRPEFRSHHFIYPIGYHLVKRYMSAIDSGISTDYVCKILDGPVGAIFEVTPQDQPGTHARASHPDDAWAQFVQDARSIRRLPPIPMDTVGEEFFGLTNLTIRGLIQELDHTESYGRRTSNEREA